MTVASLLDEIPASELVEWMAYEVIEPFGGLADDYRAGLAAAAIYNVNRGKDSEIVTPLDLIPWHEPVERTRAGPDPEAIRAVLGGRKT